MHPPIDMSIPILHFPSPGHITKSVRPLHFWERWKSLPLDKQRSMRNEKDFSHLGARVFNTFEEL
ncbi:TPA: hypothetical protein WIE93_000186 [Neisseria meningitidis]